MRPPIPAGDVMPDKLRVLLTDDEEIFRELTARLLRRRGMEATTCGDGAACLSLMEGREFDAVVLDMRMPGMDGLATIERIRERNRRTPVILLTGFMDLERVTRALKAGAAEVLLKPCPPEDLVSAIENAHERLEAAEEAAGQGAGNGT